MTTPVKKAANLTVRADLLAVLDEDFDDAAGMRRLDVERDLAGFEDDHVVVELDHVARLDQHFIDGDVALRATAAGIPAFGIDRDADFDDPAHRA